MTSTIGIVVALSAEARAVLGVRCWYQSNGFTVQRKHLEDGTDLLTIQSGVGFENTLSAAKWLVRQKATVLAVTGVSGGLDPALAAGDIIVPETIIQGDNGKAHRKWLQHSVIADHLFTRLVSEGIRVHRGAIVTSRKPVLTKNSKATLFFKTGARAVDMESAAVALVADDGKLPFFVIRAICDTSSHDAPLKFFDMLNPDGSLRWLDLIATVVHTPTLILSLLRMGRSFHSAIAALRTSWRIQMKHGFSFHYDTHYKYSPK